ncbi:MAG: alpha/beta fold hydrolase [Deltaproteobacteria bacterium]|nr:alpha/beta fold hydrolase [Deltaproteobacteria bacterium]
MAAWLAAGLLGAVVVGAAGYATVMYLAWIMVRRRRLGALHRAHPVRAYLVEWASAALMVLLAVPTLFRRRVKLAEGNGGVPVLCVHGYTQHWGNFVFMAPRLAAAGCGSVYGVNVVPRFRSMERCAAQVTEALLWIRAQTGAEKIDVICHSMGGLLLRAALARHGADGLVRRAVTLGTPHAGTIIARFGPGQNAAEMRPGSAFLAALPAPPPTLTSVWSTSDAVVLPPENAACGAGDVVFDDLGHLSLLLSPRVWRTVGERLTAPDPAHHVDG